MKLCYCFTETRLLVNRIKIVNKSWQKKDLQFIQLISEIQIRILKFTLNIENRSTILLLKLLLLSINDDPPVKLKFRCLNLN